MLKYFMQLSITEKLSVMWVFLVLLLGIYAIPLAFILFLFIVVTAYSLIRICFLIADYLDKKSLRK